MCAIEPAAGRHRAGARARRRRGAAAAREGLPRRRHRRDRPARCVPLLLAAGPRGDGDDAARRTSSQALRAPARRRWSPTRSTRGAVSEAVAAARPDAVIHQLTALPPRIDPRKIERDFALNDRLRSEGTRILVAAAAGGRRASGSRPEHRLRLRPRARRARSTPRRTRCCLDAARSRSARSARRARDARAHGARRRRHGAALRLLLRPRQRDLARGSIGRDVARRRLPIVGCGAGRVVVHPRRRRGRGDGRGARARGPAVLQHRRRRARARVGVAARRSPRRSARRARGACRRCSRGSPRAATAWPS